MSVSGYARVGLAAALAAGFSFGVVVSNVFADGALDVILPLLAAL